MSASGLEDHTYSGRMKLILMPSLKSLVLTKIATILLDCVDVRHRAWNICTALKHPVTFLKCSRKMMWLDVEKLVINKSYIVPIPYDLRKELLCHIAGTAWELSLWLEFHVIRCKILSKMPKSFQWTPHGLIDKKGMAQLLVKDSELDIISRYKLACLYCLEMDIVELWKQIPIGRRSFESSLKKKNLDEPALVSFWSHRVAGKLKLMHQEMSEYCNSCTFTPNEYAFRISVASGNEVATRFFFAKLNPEEKNRLPAATVQPLILMAPIPREVMLPFCTDFPGEHHAGVLCFFLKEVFEYTQQEVIFSNFHFALECLLDWPYQNVFMKAVHYWIDYFDSDMCYRLLSKITKKIVNEFHDYDYSKLFATFWNCISSSEVRDVVQRCLNRSFLLDLFHICDRKPIHVVLKEASSAEKESFILSECGEFVCKQLIFQNDWSNLRFFICNCISSKKNLIDIMAKLLKNELCERVEEEDSGESEEEEAENQKYLLQMFLELLNYNK